jgi:hypothetical protein
MRGHCQYKIHSRLTATAAAAAAAAPPLRSDGIKKSVAAGFFYHCAKLQKDGSYRTVKNPTTVHIHPGSSLSKEVR